jgi:drug/metabolite transporter (DMT)-like permease
LGPRRRAEILLLSVTLIWGSTFVVTKSLVGPNSPLFYTAIRFFLASATLVLIFPRRLLRIPGSAFRRGSVLGFLLFAGFACQTVGIQYTTASKSAFFTGMLTVLTPIVDFTVQRFTPAGRKALKMGNIFGVIFAGLGLYLLTSPSGSAFTGGDALTLVCALFFACYIVYLDRVSDEPDKIQLTFVQFLFCGAAGLVVALPFEEIRIAFSGEYVLSLLYLTLIATVLAMWVQNRFQGDTTPTRAAVIFAMEPVIAALLAYLVRGEVIGVAGVFGGGMIFAGLLLSEFSEEIPLLNKTVAGVRQIV